MKNHSVTSVSSPVDKVQHTPGPWHLSGQFNQCRILASENMIYTQGIKGRTLYIASTESGCNCSEEDKANAALISAAPDLLDALQSLLELYDADMEHGLVVIARAAITKAKATQ